jgi:hypothetical protein
MGWQKTFTLSKRAKGCHLVTDEIINHIRPGLQGVQVGSNYQMTIKSAHLVLDWYAFPLHVSLVLPYRSKSEERMLIQRQPTYFSCVDY